MNSSNQIPAYKEPWCWLVFSPLIAVLGVASFLLYFAYIGADDRVVDDYYKQGRMINHRFEEQRNAMALALQGHVSLSPDQQSLTVELSGRADPQRLFVELSHPSAGASDQHLVAERGSPGLYHLDLEKPLVGRWYALIGAAETEESVAWKISLEIDTQTAQRFPFYAHP